MGRAYREISVLICSQVECDKRSNIERATTAALRRLPLVRVPRVIEDSLERAAAPRPMSPRHSDGGVQRCA